MHTNAYKCICIQMHTNVYKCIHIYTYKSGGQATNFQVLLSTLGVGTLSHRVRYVDMKLKNEGTKVKFHPKITPPAWKYGDTNRKTPFAFSNVMTMTNDVRWKLEGEHYTNSSNIYGGSTNTI